MDRAIVPVILGTEIGGYGMARAFWERYGAVSQVYGTFPLTPTAHSKFIDVHIDERLLEPGRLAEVLNRDAPVLTSLGEHVLVVPCGDDYAVALAEQQDLLDASLHAVVPPEDVLKRFNDKESFYGICEEAGVPYPATVVIAEPQVPELPFGFPVALKPSDAPAWRAHPFEGQKKAFVLNSAEELAETVTRAYAAGYPGRLIIQDFIPGDDGNMRVLNGYVRGDGIISLLSVGHPLLEDYSPMAIGNYAAILSYSDDAIYRTVETLMEGNGWRGFFNIDMKYDPRDGTYRLFEVNPRAGRSSFFTTLAGYNMAGFAVDDFVDGGALEPVRAENESLWVGVPRSIVRRYAPKSPEKERALELMREGRCGTTLFGAADNDPRRLYNMAKLWIRYRLEYRRHFGQRSLAS